MKKIINIQFYGYFLYTIVIYEVFVYFLTSRGRLCIIPPLFNREMAERSKAAVLKTVDGQLSWGSNPYLPAT